MPWCKGDRLNSHKLGMELGHRQTNIGSRRCGGDLFRIVVPTNFELVTKPQDRQGARPRCVAELQQGAEDVIE
jgi:hypothetical protein